MWLFRCVVVHGDKARLYRHDDGLERKNLYASTVGEANEFPCKIMSPSSFVLVFRFMTNVYKRRKTLRKEICYK